jgi:hypothetical protein
METKCDVANGGKLSRIIDGAVVDQGQFLFQNETRTVSVDLGADLLNQFVQSTWLNHHPIIKKAENPTIGGMPVRRLRKIPRPLVRNKNRDLPAVKLTGILCNAGLAVA